MPESFNLDRLPTPIGTALLVTDAGLVQAGLAERVKAGFSHTAIEIACVYDQVPPNSTIQTVEDCAALGREQGCDLIIGLGGGSVLDTAKVANILMVKGGRVQEHMGAVAHRLDPRRQREGVAAERPSRFAH